MKGSGAGGSLPEGWLQGEPRRWFTASLEPLSLSTRAQEGAWSWPATAPHTTMPWAPKPSVGLENTVTERGSFPQFPLLKIDHQHAAWGKHSAAMLNGIQYSQETEKQ